MMLPFSCLEEKLVEEVTRIVGKDDERYFGKKEKFLGTTLGLRLCSFRVFPDLRLVLQVSVEVVLKSLS